jgi:hypothetical protein
MDIVIADEKPYQTKSKIFEAQRDGAATKSKSILAAN